MRAHLFFLFWTAALLLPCLSLVAAQGHDGNEPAAQGTVAGEGTELADEQLLAGMSYFQYGSHTGAMLGHIVFMFLAWFFTLPIGMRRTYLDSTFC